MSQYETVYSGDFDMTQPTDDTTSVVKAERNQVEASWLMLFICAFLAYILASSFLALHGADPATSRGVALGLVILIVLFIIPIGYLASLLVKLEIVLNVRLPTVDED